jgi:bifunctional DNA-binding transcriptional regulator/antitoxin component of YhaV-PrlF toxin-antitoxin module
MMKIDTVEIKESYDGELYFNIPDDTLKRLGWQEGDELIWDHDPKQQTCIIRKVRYESVELDLDDDTFSTIAKLAHKNDLTFNKQIETIMKEFIDNCEEDPEYAKYLKRFATKEDAQVADDSKSD